MNQPLLATADRSREAWPQGFRIVSPLLRLGGVLLLCCYWTQPPLFADTDVLMEAVAAEDVTAVEGILSSGNVSIERPNVHGWTPLMMAASKGNSRILKLLLDKGANVNARSNKGYSALILAAQIGACDCVDMLVENGAQIDALYDNDVSALMLGIIDGNLCTVRRLLRAGANPNHVAENFGANPLMIAVEVQRPELVKLLLQSGAAADEPLGLRRWRPLMTACLKGNVEIVTLLLQHGANPHARSLDGLTPLSIAQSEGHTEVVKVLTATKV